MTNIQLFIIIVNYYIGIGFICIALGKNGIALSVGFIAIYWFIIFYLTK